MTNNPVSTPVGVNGVRVFGGYKLPSMSSDDFFQELGQTFMPGTPGMLAGLGLAAYLPAVLDLDPALGLPDEVALIIYASRDVYAAARNTVQGRMYTHSHAGVFDMARSRGQWAGPVDQPEQLAGTDRWSWYAFNRDVDWQQGSTRVFFLSGNPQGGTLQELLQTATHNGLQALTDAGVEQALFLAATNYAAIWLHGLTRPAINLAGAGFVPGGVQIVRDMDAQTKPMPNLVETFQIAGAGAFSFRFVRDLRFFL
jgi:hypothetical protein